MTSKTDPKGYKDHKPGSRKGQVHKLFDTKGADQAWTLGLKLKLKEGTLRSWFASWAAPKKKASKTKKAEASNPAVTS